MAMGYTYFKRYRMQIDLRRHSCRPHLPRGYSACRWKDELLDAHAATKYECFRAEIDSCIFPCLSTPQMCVELMQAISGRDGFLPEATWLIEYAGAGTRRREFCGTIQGLRLSRKYGGIQNLGVTRFHRGRGIGRQLVLMALAGFQQVGLRRVELEVTADNIPAMRLYESCGFRRRKTLYKAVESVFA